MITSGINTSRMLTIMMVLLGFLLFFTIGGYGVESKIIPQAGGGVDSPYYYN